MTKLTDEMREAAESLRARCMPLGQLVPLLMVSAMQLDKVADDNDTLRARLTKAQEIMECNDPLNARELFGEHQHEA
jgi:hypothetical protein